MTGSDQIDIVCSVVDQPEIKCPQFIGSKLCTGRFGTDIMILAENTMQIAAGKKNGAAASFAADDRLFPEVQTGTGDYCILR